MVLGKIKDYAIAGLVVVAIGLGATTVYLKMRNSHLSDKLATVSAQLEKAESNLVLVSDQLKEETRLKESAEEALDDLRSIPDEIYSKELDPALGNVIRNFHERVR